MNQSSLFLQILIFILIIFGIIGINYSIFIMLRNNKSDAGINHILKTVNSLRQPFNKEDQQLNELSRLTSELSTILEKEKNNKQES